MRVTSMFAGFAVALAACGGGEQKTDGQQTTTQDQQAPAPTPAAGGEAAAGTGATHNVDMVFEDGKYKFVPENLTIKSGDVVNFHNKKGPFPHNVSFWADSIPAGAAEVLQANMPGEKMQPLVGPMLLTEGEVYTVKFTNAPAGTYKYYCFPHLAMGMVATLNVE